MTTTLDRANMTGHSRRDPALTNLIESLARTHTDWTGKRITEELISLGRTPFCSSYVSEISRRARGNPILRGVFTDYEDRKDIRETILAVAKSKLGEISGKVFTLTTPELSDVSQIYDKLGVERGNIVAVERELESYNGIMDKEPKIRVRLGELFDEKTVEWVRRNGPYALMWVDTMGAVQDDKIPFLNTLKQCIEEGGLFVLTVIKDGAHGLQNTWAKIIENMPEHISFEHKRPGNSTSMITIIGCPKKVE